MIIDSHHHFWNFDPIQFDWINEDMSVIQKNYLPVDLKAEISKSGVDGVVSVQARQTVHETEWLLQLASGNDFIKGVVGWIPLASENIQDILEKYRENQWLKAVRHVVQGEPDPAFILGKEFNRGISLLKNYNLVYDILIFEHQLPNTIRFVDQHPNQQFILDHVAKPRIKSKQIVGWSKNLKELAKRENISCKISGIVTEADFSGWSEEQLQPYFDVVMEAFGPSRLLFGSDWPVCLVAISYSGWLSLVKKFVSELSVSEQEQILSKNAIQIYHLD